MGSAVSHEAMDESCEGSHSLTPSKRVLYVDPRSPSAGIDRTPILVEKTPPADAFWDPRSPTVGIVRTPLSSINNRSKQAETTAPMSAADTERVMSPVKFDNLALNIEDSDDVVNSELADPLSLHKLSLLEESEEDSCQLLPASQDQSISSENRVDFGRKVPINKPLAKQLFSKREKRQGSRVNSSDNRSPLRSRNQDVASPRNILQRKQINSVDNKMSYRYVNSKSTPPSQDKENLTDGRLCQN